MASNFKILCNRSSDGMHLKLVGDFDGSSACELINHLQKYGNTKSKIVIHTRDLTDVCGFGLNVFAKRWPLMGKLKADLSFMGKHKNKFASLQIDSHEFDSAAHSG